MYLLQRQRTAGAYITISHSDTHDGAVEALRTIASKTPSMPYDGGDQWQDSKNRHCVNRYRIVAVAVPQKKTFIVRLQNTSFPDDDDRVISVETDKSLSEFEKAYDKVRSDWYEEDSPTDLMDYLTTNLSKQGFNISGFNFDAVLKF